MATIERLMRSKCLAIASKKAPGFLGSGVAVPLFFLLKGGSPQRKKVLVAVRPSANKNLNEAQRIVLFVVRVGRRRVDLEGDVQKCNRPSIERVFGDWEDYLIRATGEYTGMADLPTFKNAHAFVEEDLGLSETPGTMLRRRVHVSQVKMSSF